MWEKIYCIFYSRQIFCLIYIPSGNTIIIIFPRIFCNSGFPYQGPPTPNYHFLRPPDRGAYTYIVDPYLASIFAISITCSFTVAYTCTYTRTSYSLFFITCQYSYIFYRLPIPIFPSLLPINTNIKIKISCNYLFTYACSCVFVITVSSSSTCASAVDSACVKKLQESSGALVHGCHNIVQWYP